LSTFGTKKVVQFAAAKGATSSRRSPPKKLGRFVLIETRILLA
jgi:hypothetical protein